MFERLFTVCYIDTKKCFCYMSPNNSKELESNIIKLTRTNGDQFYFSVDSSKLYIDSHTLGIGSLYAKVLGITENELVSVLDVGALSTINSVVISPNSVGDYDVAELLLDNIQSTLLDQVKVLNSKQKIVIWIGNSVYIIVDVCDIKPASPGRIDELAEVTIKNPIQKHSFNLFKEKCNTYTFSSLSQTNMNIFTSHIWQRNMVFRLTSLKSIRCMPEEFLNPFNVFVSRLHISSLNSATCNLSNYQIFCLKLLHNYGSNHEGEIVYVKLFILEDILKNIKSHFILSQDLFVTEEVFRYFDCPIGSRVTLQLCTQEVPEVSEIEVCTKRNHSADVKKLFEEYLINMSKKGPIILNPYITLTISKNITCFLQFKLPQKFCVIQADFLRHIKVYVNFDSLLLNETIKDDTVVSRYLTTVTNFEKILDCSLNVVGNYRLKGCLNNILLIGEPGKGKTSLLKLVKGRLNSSPFRMFIRNVNCSSLKGKSLEALQKLFTSDMFDLIHHQPSFLTLDDIDNVFEDFNENETATQNSLYYNRISEMFRGLFRKYCEHNLVTILATARTVSKLNKNICGIRGIHFFAINYSIGNLNKADKITILRHLLRNYVVNNTTFERTAEIMESFVFRDIKDFVNKAIYECFQNDYDGPTLNIDEKVLNTSLRATTVALLHGIKISPESSKNLNDVGGLEEAKSVLTEMLFWPSKYMNLFSKAPLRYPSGLLLYGPPGTGKTMVVGAVANHLKIRLISVKGPEILSKYIGASEQNVRDVFKSAQSAKPCILFFDEFDSIAPRRGHDNTGVTDRVVNQLLTQLDGIESLVGIFVLAATSRPDLLDPALVRPGRLDRQIFCPLPDESSRLSILQALSKSIKLSVDVNLPEIARISEGFSGADLQLLLCNAQESAVTNLHSNEVCFEKSELEINHLQLDYALKLTKPSVTQQDNIKFEKMYRSFQRGTVGDFYTGSRTSLA